MNFSWISIAVLALALYISVLVHQDQGIMTEISRRGASYSFKNEQISIIVPTYKEVMNLRILTERVFDGTLTDIIQSSASYTYSYLSCISP